jgi:hypothetical protein
MEMEMRYVSINDEHDHTLVQINQQACGLNDQQFDEFVMAVTLTLANWTGKQLTKEVKEV